MDPITGIGLAASVVQLVQFSIVAAQTCQQIYQDGSTKEHLDTGDIARQLADLAGSLRQSLLQQMPQPPVLSKEEKQLLDIASKCETSANTLKCELQKLQTPPRASVLTVALKAARSIQKKKSIKEIQERLFKYRTVLETSLLHNLSERFKAQDLRNSERFTCLDDTLKNVIIRLAKSQTSLAALVQQESEHTRQQIAAQVANESLFRDVTQSLFFADMTTRQIHVAYEFDGIEDSYDWIFDEPTESNHAVDQEHEGCYTQSKWNNFSRWLKYGNSVYWINGKAGSGKSTLMNYVCDHKKKGEYLRQWSAGKRLLTPAFFFWNAGSRQQKSIDGLLRSLVYQMLTECPGLIAYFENKSLPTWTEERLLDVLSILLTQSEIPLATCLFVDGLDEFEGHYDAVVETMIRLANEPNVKICLSSRPLLRFEKAFTAMPSLKLQELTFNSIYTYAEEKLNPLIESRKFHHEDERVVSQGLLREIVWRAEGVFLWAVIAIREVRDGLNDFVDLHDLARAIEDLPPEIESLYMKMISRIKPVYRRGAARILQTIIYYSTTWETGPDLFGMYLIEEENVSGDMPLKCKQVGIEDIARACQALKSRVNSHTRGLIDLIAIDTTPVMQTKYSLDAILRTEVQVFHRTVKEFLLHNPTARTFMTTAGIVEEHLRLSIARGLFAEMFYISRQNGALDPAIEVQRKPYFLLRSAMIQLSIVERMTGAAQLNLIDSLHSHRLLTKGFPIYRCSVPYFLVDEHKPVVDLIGAAASSGMFRYICHVLNLPVEKNGHYYINLLDFQQVYSAEEATVSILEWDVAPDLKLDYPNSTMWLDKSLLKWRQQKHTDVELKRQMDGITLTYLLQCCEVSMSDPNLLETISLVRTLLRAGADPMVRYGLGDSSYYFPRPRNCFWLEWITFLIDSQMTRTGSKLPKTFPLGSYRASGCEDSRVTLNDCFDTTKVLIAHGANINSKLESFDSGWEFGLRRYRVDMPELVFDISSSVMFLLEEYFSGYREFREFAARARAQAPSKRPWRKILSIRHYTRDAWDNHTRAHLDEDEAERLWPLIEKWEESGDWRDLDALRLTTRQIFKAHRPDVKLDGDTDEDMNLEVYGEIDEGMD